MHTMELLSQRRYRKHGDGVYDEILTGDEDSSNRYRTYAWKRVCSIQEFIYENVTRELNYAMWKNLTSSLNNTKMIADHIEESVESDFPSLNFNRHLFSFKNGILSIYEMVFYPYAEKDNWDEIARFAEARLRIHEPDAHVSAPSRSDASSKYFETEFTLDTLFDDMMDLDPSTIDTPEIKKVLDDQRLDEDTQEWFYTMLGRLLYDIGRYDNWQVLLFLKGVAGSGKSTIAQLMKFLYTLDHVGVLSSNAEGKFGLAPLYKRKLVICPEAKRDFSISQGDVQSMVSGEDVSVRLNTKTQKPSLGKRLFCFAAMSCPTGRTRRGRWLGAY